MSSVAGAFKLLSFITFSLCFKSKSTGLTIEKVILSGICNFCLIQAKNRRLKMRFVFCE